MNESPGKKFIKIMIQIFRIDINDIRFLRIFPKVVGSLGADIKRSSYSKLGKKSNQTCSLSESSEIFEVFFRFNLSSAFTLDKSTVMNRIFVRGINNAVDLNRLFCRFLSLIFGFE